MKELAKKDLIEGEKAFERFDALVGKVLSVPRSEMQRRIEEHRKQTALNPNKRGPKPKRKSSP